MAPLSDVPAANIGLYLKETLFSDIAKLRTGNARPSKRTPSPPPHEGAGFVRGRPTALHLFSGPSERNDGMATYLRKLGRNVLEYDIICFNLDYFKLDGA